MTTRSLVSIITAGLWASLTLTGCQLHGKPHVARAAVRPAASRLATHSGEPARAAAPLDSAATASVIAPGIVEPWGAQVELSAQEPGWIAAILVREGEVVRAGQTLALLEDTTQRRALELARAELAEAEAARRKTETGATPEERRQALAELQAAEARRDFARAAAERTARLKAGGSLPEIEKDRTAAEAAAQTALADRAQARLEELTRGARSEDLSAARARVAGARARVQLAQANLDRRRVTSPSPGTVLLSRFHAGEFYTAEGGPLLVLGDLTRLQVRLEVDEIDAADVQVGAPCTLSSDGGRVLARGTVAREAPRMGRRGLPLESPTARVDVRILEVFIEVSASAPLVPGQRVWGDTPRNTRRSDT